MKPLVRLYHLNALRLLPIHRIDDCMPVHMTTLGQEPHPHNFRMPILNGLEATQQVRQLEATQLAKTDRLAHSLNGGRIPHLRHVGFTGTVERQREELEQVGIDGWMLKPIDFGRLYNILRGVTDPVLLCKANDEYRWRQLGDRWVAAATLTTTTYCISMPDSCTINRSQLRRSSCRS